MRYSMLRTPSVNKELRAIELLVKAAAKPERRFPSGMQSHSRSKPCVRETMRGRSQTAVKPDHISHNSCAGRRYENKLGSTPRAMRVEKRRK